MRLAKKYNVWAAFSAHTYALLGCQYLKEWSFVKTYLLGAKRLPLATEPFEAQIVLPDKGIQGPTSSRGGIYL